MSGTHRIATCTNCGQTRIHNAHGWCRTCYGRWKKNGRPADGVPERRTSGPTVAAVRCDIDTLVVEHALAGYRPELNPGERRAAIDALIRRGLTYEQTADRLGCTDRTVARHVAALKKG